MSWSTVTESANLSRMIKEAGIKSNGASPATVSVSIFIEVPSKIISGQYVPDESTLPTILQSTQLASNTNIIFSTAEDVDFAEKNRLGELRASYVIGNVDASGNPTTFLVKRNVACVSGQVSSESFKISTNPVPFFTLSLSKTDISEILNIEIFINF